MIESQKIHSGDSGNSADFQFNRLANIVWIVSGITFILSLIAIIIKVSASSEVATLRYNIIVGVSEIGNRYELFKLPGAGLAIGIINYALTRFNKSDQKVLSLLASIITLVVNIILLFASLLLFQVN
jgi:hypothetical protein